MNTNAPLLQEASLDVSAHQEQTRQLVRAMMTLTGHTASGLARAAGLTPSTVNRFMHRAVGHTLSQRTMLALMTETFVALKKRPLRETDRPALSVLAPAIAIYEKGILEKAPDASAALADAKSTMESGTQETTVSAGDLPVLLASTTGVNPQAGDFAAAPLRTQRPPFLASDPKAFALLMPDGSMSPRFDAGDMLYVSPGRTLEGGRVDVALERRTGGFMIAALSAATVSSVRVSTLSPRVRETVARDKVRGIYRIIGVQRLSA